jgi:predicted ATPase/DNA-binding winged helix-turn-helix (wHTH) protein
LEHEVTDARLTRLGEFSFGPFRLLPGQKLLLENKSPVRLGGRATEILVALVERSGVLVTKEELLARVWPKTFVDESNLKVHIARLRKALGDGRGNNRYIVSDPGRGYRFVAPVSFSSQPAPPVRAATCEDRPREFSSPILRIVGRSDTIAALARRLLQDRFITIVGPGGIGKTTVAMAVADALAATFEGGVRFVDLAPLSDPALVTSSLAASLGVAVRAENAIRSLISFLEDKRILIVLDNCEHVIETAASLAEELFSGAVAVHVLATSREPLRAGGEHVHRLAPLATPAVSQELTAAQALASPAVQLFVERAAASLHTFELSDKDAPVVAELCRRLDGIPLAIEIVAGSVQAFGVGALATLMDDRLRLLMPGRRTAQLRHQTLRTTLDWSYELLPEIERTSLRRLGIFPGIFTWESAGAVLDQGNGPAADVFDSISNLIAKSLVTAITGGKIYYYRLLDTTRAYALMKLNESGEAGLLARRHAEHYRKILAQARIEWDHRPAVEWLEAHRYLIDNVRAALDWAFSASGDAAIGVSLTAATVPLWFQLLLVSECRERVERALFALSANPDQRCEMQLQAALAWSLMQTRGSVEKTRNAWIAVLKHSENLGDIDYQLRALWGLWTGLLNNAQLKEALAIAERFCAVATKSVDPSDSLVGDRLVGYILHLLGDQTGARPRIERMLDQYAAPVTGPRAMRFVFDQRVAARCILARILWLQGLPDRAVSAVESALAEAKASNDTFTYCQALIQAGCPVSILVGDLESLGPFVTMLLDYAARHSLGFWRAWGRCFKGVHLIKSGDIEDGLILLSEGLDELREMQYGVYYAVFLCEFADGLGRGGQPARGLVAIDEALARSRRNHENWYISELLRVKGELLLRTGGTIAASHAEKLFRQSLALARRKKTPAWELRTAVSLSRLWREHSRATEAEILLKSAYDKFTEGFDTVDLVVARRLLDDLSQTSSP